MKHFSKNEVVDTEFSQESFQPKQNLVTAKFSLKERMYRLKL